jgi:osmotically inducible protein OsmC
MNPESLVALRSGTATWIGDGKEGAGIVSTESGALQRHPYTVKSRFMSAAGTNPEELIAAAHASSFTMYLSLILADAGFVADRLDTTAIVTLESDHNGFAISRLHLVLTASVPLVDNATFQSFATRAKANCAISRLLSAEITLNAKLVDQKSTAAQGDGLERLGQ